MRAKILLATGIFLIAVPFFYFTGNSSKTLSTDLDSIGKNNSMTASGKNYSSRQLLAENQLKKSDDPDLQALKTEIAQLKVELQTLKNQFTQYQFNSISDSGEESIETDDNVVTSKQENEEIFAAMEEQEKKILELQASQHIQRREQLNDSFMEEVVDNSWSYQATDTINQALQTTQLDGTSVIDVQCKSSMCRVEVEHKDFDIADEFMMWFPQIVLGTFPDLMIDRQNEGDFYTTVVFLARKGTDFPERYN